MTSNVDSDKFANVDDFAALNKRHSTEIIMSSNDMGNGPTGDDDYGYSYGTGGGSVGDNWQTHNYAPNPMLNTPKSGDNKQGGGGGAGGAGAGGGGGGGG